MVKVLVTGCLGFIGSHFTKYVLKNTDWEVVEGYWSDAGTLDSLMEAAELVRYYSDPKTRVSQGDPV